MILRTSEKSRNAHQTLAKNLILIRHVEPYDFILLLLCRRVCVSLDDNK